MKIRELSVLVALCMVCALLAAPTSAVGNDAAVLTVRALGIMKGDTNGNMNLDSNVTRAQFATMLTAASSYKNSISTEGSGYSLFRDVKSSHWASEYIRLALEKGWMVGYTDGTFRPDQTVKLEEACTAVLKLLGYDSASLAGSFPSAQLAKASALGLRDQISKGQGTNMTRRDCAYLFYNLMTATTSTGQVYAATLGYSVTNGEVDYTALVRDNLSGPYVAESGAVSLSFQPTAIYRNGESSNSSAVNQYDVYYYNESMGTLWIYSDRASGKITALSPSSTSPTSVTISGITYEIGSSTAAYKLSAVGGGGTGKVVTLLLGMDDAVVDVLTGTEAEALYCGVVKSSSRSAREDGNAAVQTSVTVICTDGVERVFTVDQDTTYTTGRLVTVQVSDGGVTMKSLTEKHTSGKVNTSGTKLGDLAFAENIEVLDTNSEGAAASVDASRLAGCSLSTSDVRYYTLDQDGKIKYLILNNVTGDLWSYAYLTRQNDQSQDMSISVSYTYLTNGMEKSLQSNQKYAVALGGIAISYDSDGGVRSMRSLKSLKITELSTSWAMADNQKLTVSEEVQVYLRQNGNYYLTTLSSVNPEDYTVTGWCDDFGCAAGGQIRLIVAVEKNS